MSKYGVLSGPYFPEKTPYLEIFLAVKYTTKDMFHTKVTYNDNDNNSE